MQIISKIENGLGVTNIEEILDGHKKRNIYIKNLKKVLTIKIYLI